MSDASRGYHETHLLRQDRPTLAAAASDESTIRELFERGVDVFRLNFRYGTQSDHAQRLRTIDVGEMIERASRAAIAEGFARPGEDVVVVAGLSFGHSATTNLLHVARCSG